MENINIKLGEDSQEIKVFIDSTRSEAGGLSGLSNVGGGVNLFKQTTVAGISEIKSLTSISNKISLTANINTVDLSVNDSNLTIQKSQIPNLISDLNILSNQITALNNTVGGFDDRIDSVESQVSSINTQILSINLSISDIGGDLSSLSSTVDNLQTQINSFNSALNNKVDKVTGKGLSTEDYTTIEKNKLAKITVSPANSGQALIFDGTNFIPQDIEVGGAVDSVNGKTGVVVLNKNDIGLSDVDNTSDLNKPVSNATQTSLNNKVDKVTGKGLSTEDYTSAEKTKLSGIQTGATANQSDSYLLDRANHTGNQLASTISNFNSSAKAATLDNGITQGVIDKAPSQDAVYTALQNKVDKVAGKGLSTEDYTSAEKSKLAGIQANATANSSDATLLNRANHTGTQLANTISDFNTAADARVAAANKLTTKGDLLTNDGTNNVRQGVGTNGQVLTVDSTVANGLKWATPTAGGLVNFTEGLNNTGVNATRPVVSLTPNNAAANVDILLMTKGEGAIVTRMPDGTGAGGNKRGKYATDLQRLSGLPSAVAGGDYSTIMGGTGNRANASFSVVGGGNGNDIPVNADGAFVGGGSSNYCNSYKGGILSGENNTINGDNSFIGAGGLNTISTTYSAIVSGYQNSIGVNANYSFVGGGQMNIINAGARYSAILGGAYNKIDSANAYGFGIGGWNKNINNLFFHSNNKGTVADGKTQYERIIMSGSGTGTSVLLTSDATVTATANNTIVLQNNEMKTFDICLAIYNSGGTVAAFRQVEGAIRRGANAASTAFVGVPTVNNLGEDMAAMTNGYAVNVAVNTTLGGLTITVTQGAAGSQLNGKCYVQMMGAII